MFAAAVLMFFTPLPSTSLTVNVGPPPGYCGSSTCRSAGLASDWSIRIRLAPSLLRQHLRTESSDHSGRHSESRLGLTGCGLARYRLTSVQVRRPSTLAVYPSKTTYDLENARVSPTVTLELPHGIVAEMYTIVDDALLLSHGAISISSGRGATEPRNESA